MFPAVKRRGTLAFEAMSYTPRGARANVASPVCHHAHPSPAVTNRLQTHWRGRPLPRTRWLQPTPVYTARLHPMLQALLPNGCGRHVTLSRSSARAKTPQPVCKTEGKTMAARPLWRIGVRPTASKPFLRRDTQPLPAPNWCNGTRTQYWHWRHYGILCASQLLL